MLLCKTYKTLVYGENLCELVACHSSREVTDESVENIIRRLICACASEYDRCSVGWSGEGKEIWWRTQRTPDGVERRNKSEGITGRWRIQRTLVDSHLQSVDDVNLGTATLQPSACHVRCNDVDDVSIDT